MSTFYAAFPDSTKAEQLVRHLLGDGIELDDISLVTRDETNIEQAAVQSVGDASFFVGRDDDPTHDLVDERSPAADYEAVEEDKSGRGGIDTSDRTRTGDTVDQQDDSQWLAEDSLEPREETSHSKHEMDDINHAMHTGFPSPPTPIDNVENSGMPRETEYDRSLEPVPVKGLGLVMGGGDLATAAFDWAGKNGQPDSSAFLTYLQDEGVPPGPANELLGIFGNGGAIMAVAIQPRIDEQALDDVARNYGAVTAGWFGAPRF